MAKKLDSMYVEVVYKVDANTYKRIEDGTKKLGNEFEFLGKKVENTEVKTDSLSSSFSETIKNGLGIIALVGSFAAVGTAITGAINEYSKFDYQVRKVNATMGGTAENRKQLAEAAAFYGKTTQFTASQTGEALQFMAMAGWKAEESIAALPGVLNMASASGEDLASVSDIMTDQMTAFRLEAKEATRVADIFAYTANSSNVSIVQMGESFKYAGGTAALLGVSIEDLSAAVGLAGNASIKGSISGTALRTGMLRLLDPTDKAIAAMESYGIKVKETSGKNKGEFVGMYNLLNQLESATKGKTKAETATLLSTLFGKEGVATWMAILGQGSKAFKEFSDEIKMSSGSAQKATDEMTGGIEGKLLSVTSKMEGLRLEFAKPLENTTISTLNEYSIILDKVDSSVKRNEYSIVALGDAMTGFVKIVSGVADVVDVLLVAPLTGAVEVLGQVGKSLGALASGDYTAALEQIKLINFEYRKEKSEQAKVEAEFFNKPKEDNKISTEKSEQAKVEAEFLNKPKEKGRVSSESIMFKKETFVQEKIKSGVGMSSVNNVNNISLVFNSKGEDLLTKDNKINPSVKNVLDNYFNTQNKKTMNLLNPVGGY